MIGNRYMINTLLIIAKVTIDDEWMDIYLYRQIQADDNPR